MIACGELGSFFLTLRCLERQLSRRGSGVGNWGRRGVERNRKGGGGGGGGGSEGEKVRRKRTYKDFDE